MSFENSPSLDEFENGIPKKLSDPSARRNRVRFLGILFVALLLILMGVSFADSNAADLLAAKGSISGQAIDENGHPFVGDILILGSEVQAKTQADGSFLIEGVPAGARVLVLANAYTGYEFPVQVIAGETVAVGQIQFIATATP